MYGLKNNPVVILFHNKVIGMKILGEDSQVINRVIPTVDLQNIAIEINSLIFIRLSGFGHNGIQQLPSVFDPTSTCYFGYYYNGGHRRASEGYAGTDATTTGTDTTTAGTNAEAT